MKRVILLVTLLATIFGCGKGGSNGSNEPIVGEWHLTHSGRIVDGAADVEPIESIMKYTFNKNGSGWHYVREDEQWSFEWSLSGDQLALANMKIEIGVPPVIDPGSHRPDGDWTVLKLTSDELMISYWMLPAPHLTDESPYEAVRIFEKVK